MKGRFHRSARHVSLIAALAIIFVWVTTGALFSYSDTWQLIICTVTVMSTLLVVLLVQSVEP